jgi:hypothetical protein
MTTRHSRRSPAADDSRLAQEVDSLINTMGLDPAIKLDGDEPAEPAPSAPPKQAAADDQSWKTAIDPEVHAAEIALVEAHAKARLAIEVERIKAEAAAQRQTELANQEAAATAERERAVTEARTLAEAAARESMASELARARSEAEQQLARELERSREQIERQLTERLGQSRADADRDREATVARSRAEAEATRAAAMQEARLAADAAATRALEGELVRVRTETEAKLQTELASLREQAETARRLQAQAQQQAEVAREQAARDVQAAAQRAAAKAFEVEAARIRSEAEARLKEEGERTRTEANQRLEAEVAKLRAEHEERARRQPAPVATAFTPVETVAAPSPAPETPPSRSIFGDRLAVSDSDDANETPTWKVWTAAAAAAAAIVILGTGGYLLWDRVSPPAKDPGPAAEVAATEPVAPTVPAPRNRRNGRPAADAARGQKPQAAPAVEGGKASSGLLTVYSRVPLDLIVDGVRVGSTEDGQLVVPAGRRRVELVNKRLNYRGEVTLDVPNGQVTTHTATLPPGQLRIAGAPGGEVWVEGEHVGTLPLGDISVPLGTREVLVRHPLFGERRQMVEVTYGAPTQVSMMQQEGAGSPADAASRLAPLSAPPPPRSDAIK